MENQNYLPHVNCPMSVICKKINQCKDIPRILISIFLNKQNTKPSTKNVITMYEQAKWSVPVISKHVCGIIRFYYLIFLSFELGIYLLHIASWFILINASVTTPNRIQTEAKPTNSYPWAVVSSCFGLLSMIWCWVRWYDRGITTYYVCLVDKILQKLYKTAFMDVYLDRPFKGHDL